MAEQLARDRLRQGLNSLGEFANDFAEMHALGAGLLSSAVLLEGVPPTVRVLALFGVLMAIEDIFGEGHYFLIGLGTGVYVLA